MSEDDATDLYKQYKNAYPTVEYDEPPNASNGYGWHGNGMGWQNENIYPSLDNVEEEEQPDGEEDVEEQVISSQKVSNQQAFYGEKGSGIRSRGPPQDFYDLRDQHLANGTLFEDPQFPANNSSLYYSERPDKYLEWRRPPEICNDPKLFVEGFSRFDVQQGELGDCWLLAAIANLTLYHRLFFQVVPDDQAFYDKYAGIFHFRFWQYGRWIDIVIDDRLPTYRGELVYMRSSTENEFWSALLEKAYAKLHGSYEALKGGSTCEAMEDFTGGVTEVYDLQTPPQDLFKILMKAYQKGSLMGCSIEPDPHTVEMRMNEGLVKGHAYSITKVQYVEIHTPNTSGKIPLLRLRNPWGDDTEWNGPWSDSSPEWQFIPPSEKEGLGLNFDSDGEFWMSFKDFNRFFDRVEICNLSPYSLEGSNVSKWELSYYEGEWVRGITAGGCRNYLDTFASNPQYRITLTQADDEEEDGKCTVIVALMQKNRRSQRKMGLDELSIGFVIYYLPHPDRAPKPLDRNFFKHNAIVARCPTYINLREVSCRFRLPPGTYCIIPSTFEPDEEGEFLIRVFSEHQNNMEENDNVVGVLKDADTGDAQVISEDDQKRVVDYFWKLAGNEEEIHWHQLQKLLIFALESDLGNSYMQKQYVANAEAAPTQTDNTGGGEILEKLLELFCMRFCKDTPIADFLPKAEETPLMASPSQQTVTGNKGFGDDVCRSLVAMMDCNYSGRLGLDEFKVLWVQIKHWTKIFQRYDRDHSGNLSGFELRDAINSVGYTLNNHTLNIIMHRYGTNGAIQFENWIMLIVKLKNMIETFNGKDTAKQNVATFTLPEWIDTTLYS